jgi:flavin reductase (DIM6/NTAB) family NADH-FMN oxidoreductase RutF
MYPYIFGGVPMIPPSATQGAVARVLAIELSVHSLTNPILRAFAGTFVTGVAIIAARTADTRCHGLTVNSVTSLSLEPPLYLVCLDNRSNTLAAVVESKRFAINFLASHQANISQRFASKEVGKFDEIDYRLGELGCPLIDEVVAACECRVSAIHPGGDHKIVIGTVEHIHIFGGDPLVFHKGEYVEPPRGNRVKLTHNVSPRLAANNA